MQPLTDIFPPIIKWPGGKDKELKYILPALPEFRRYFEPFVGGGSVLMAVDAKEYYINDLSEELVSLYRCIAQRNSFFFEYSFGIDASWKAAGDFYLAHPELPRLFLQYRSDGLTQDGLKREIKLFCERNSAEIINIVAPFSYKLDVLKKEMEQNLSRKILRMKELELQKNILPEEDIHLNLQTAVKSAVYMYYRALYNSPDIREKEPYLYTAVFLFIRNYAYSGMFRYSSKGDFNVPYGGIGYNNKYLYKKLSYYISEPVYRRFARTKIYCLDFEKFLEERDPGEKDFIFLDPPYDTEFSTYSQNSFTRKDHERLAEYLLNRCKAKWMLVIKNTDFISQLYNHPGVNMQSFEKNYTVSFMNRNDKKTTHLLITNY